MKRFPLFCALIILSASSAAAQANFTYRFDNFDTRDGVRVELPAQPKPARQSKRQKLAARNVGASAPLNPQKSSALRSSEAAYTPSVSVSMAVGKSLDGFSTGDASVDRFIVESGRRHGVDPVLLYSIMHRESSFKRFALSPKGARGLMQLMPATAVRFGVTNIFDPRQNIEGAARYVRWLLDKFDGDVRLTLAGYNAGEGAVMKYGYRVPPYRETQEYVRRITQRYALMRDPATARIAPRVSRTQIAKLTASEPLPLVYEREVFAVRTPDGKLRLISQ
ncbi:MAG: lytic transglycosylase domain-containing protein [Rubrivivax sp.]|nr:lytic transglycosylase domain-containing protein [Pyrinomonadaceae bacterium]